LREVIFNGWGKWVDTDIYGSITYELGLDYECVGILAMSDDDEFKYDNGFIKVESLTRLYPCLHPECHFEKLKRIFQNGDCIYHFAFYNQDGIAITHAEHPTFLIRKILHIKINERSENPSETPAKDTSTAPIIKKEKPNEPEKRICQLHIFLWRVHESLRETSGKLPSAISVWREIKHNYEKYDHDGIILEVDNDQIQWQSIHNPNPRNPPTFKFKSWQSRMSLLRKNPPSL
jgi:hypothetical protein